MLGEEGSRHSDARADPRSAALDKREGGIRMGSPAHDLIHAGNFGSFIALEGTARRGIRTQLTSG